MKIEKVTVKNFKRFDEQTFDLEDHIIIAGPNNTGKTTLLQAIATWHLALEQWQNLNNYHRRGGAYEKAPIARQAFSSVPLRTFDMLWHQRVGKSEIEITLRIDGVDVTVEILKDSTEQAYVRPGSAVEPEWLKKHDNFPRLVFVPAMTGLSIEEPVYQQPKINQLLGQGKPGDVIRNLLVSANQDQEAWNRLKDSIQKMFNYSLLEPDARGPHIIVEYQAPLSERLDNVHATQATLADLEPVQNYDIASAGSGFQQILMLLTFLSTHKGAVLMVDEPDAHLHVILQDVIYNELRKSAKENNAQLIIATHSEVVINAAEPKEIYALLGTPRRLADNKEKNALMFSLSALSNTDVMLAYQKRKVIYTEGHTDMDILRAWAHVLNHRVKGYLQQPFWKPAVFETRHQKSGIRAENHFESLCLVEENILGAQIIDRDGNSEIPKSKMLCDDKLLRLCWDRYEIESYLVHPDVLARFIGKVSGTNAPLANVDEVKNTMAEDVPRKVIDQPLENHSFLETTKARTTILPSILEKAGLSGMPYTRYWEIAETMLPEEIHPEITEKLDAIANHLKL